MKKNSLFLLDESVRCDPDPVPGVGSGAGSASGGSVRPSGLRLAGLLLRGRRRARGSGTRSDTPIRVAHLRRRRQFPQSKVLSGSLQESAQPERLPHQGKETRVRGGSERQRPVSILGYVLRFSRVDRLLPSSKSVRRGSRDCLAHHHPQPRDIVQRGKVGQRGKLGPRPRPCLQAQRSTLVYIFKVIGQAELLVRYGGVNPKDIRGMRAPFLAVGGDTMFR